MITIERLLCEKLNISTQIKNPYFSCYQLEKKKYIIFWNKEVNKENMQLLLEKIGEYCKGEGFSEWKSIIFVAPTNQTFKKEELMFFDNVSTFVSFYFLDFSDKKIYMNNEWISVLGLNYKKNVNKITEILREEGYIV